MDDYHYNIELQIFLPLVETVECRKCLKIFDNILSSIMSFKPIFFEHADNISVINKKGTSF